MKINCIPENQNQKELDEVRSFSITPKTDKVRDA